MHLEPGRDWKDVAAGAASVALKRASLFGRAPVVHDLTVAFGVWGFLDDDPDGDLLGAASQRLRRASATRPTTCACGTVVDAVPAETLRLTHSKVLADARPATGGRCSQLDELASLRRATDRRRPQGIGRAGRRPRLASRG